MRSAPPPRPRHLPITYRYLTILLLGGVLLACIPPSDEPTEVAVVLDLNDPVTQRIYDYQNDRRTDSLLGYLTDANPSYRYQAARAFGSFPALAPPVRDSLARRLSDPQPLVREAAAYSLGQSGDSTAAAALLANFD